MEFEWDENKRQEILIERGIDILDAALIFENPILALTDDRLDYGEVRLKAIGLADGNYYVLIYTIREEIVRLITCWKANKNDKRRYQACYPIPNTGKEK